jgi:hypothetical protein
MTELILKNNIDRQKLDSIIIFLKSWGIDAEIKSTEIKKNADTKTLFAESFGMWAERDIDIKEIRQTAYKRRTKSYGHGTL